MKHVILVRSTADMGTLGGLAAAGFGTKWGS